MLKSIITLLLLGILVSCGTAPAYAIDYSGRYYNPKCTTFLVPTIFCV